MFSVTHSPPFNLCVDGNISVSAAHAPSINIQRRLESAVPGMVLNTHLEDEIECKHKGESGQVAYLPFGEAAESF